MGKKIKKKETNFLDYVPAVKEDLTWHDDGENVVLHLENKGFYNRVAQKFFNAPPVSKISLDQYGSFVWKQIDGKRNVLQIGDLMKTHFGSNAEPAYDRAAQFVKMLHNAGFITY